MSEPDPVAAHGDVDAHDHHHDHDHDRHHDHDHAWRRVRGDPAYGTAMEYLCDICGLHWSL